MTNSGEDTTVQHDDALEFTRSLFGTKPDADETPGDTLSDADQTLTNTIQARNIFTNTRSN